jgi:hypothetical protein
MRAEITADQMRDETVLRLESLLGEALGMLGQETFYSEAGQELDDRAVRLRAVDEARRIVESLAKVNGVDKPVAEEDAAAVTRIEIVGLDPKDLV